MKKINTFADGAAFRFQLLVLIFLIAGNSSKSQCTNQVTHLHGTKTINGVNVNVTWTGIVDSNVIYCPATMPYFAGYRYASDSSGNGSYLFNFSPPVSAVSLNFSGMTNITGVGIEKIRLIKNGVHYSIPAAGNGNGCDALAVITPEGDIIGCTGCGLAGMNQITVPGPVTSVEIKDTLIFWSHDGPNGTIFSLFICEPVTGVEDFQNEVQLQVYPNPFVSRLNITSASDKQLQFVLYDIMSSKLLQQNILKSASVNTEKLPKGIYLYEIKDGNNTIRKDKIIKE